MLTRAPPRPARLPPVDCDCCVLCTVRSAEGLVAGAEDDELELEGDELLLGLLEDDQDEVEVVEVVVGDSQMVVAGSQMAVGGVHWTSVEVVVVVSGEGDW